MDIVFVHGSVETSCEPMYLDALAMAAIKGYESIKLGLLDAVEQAVMEMEDNPLFNAGYGSVLNYDGEVEMDASIMDGANGTCGAVAAIQNVKNPVHVARKVAEETSHVILAGKGATDFARKSGFAYFNPVTDLQRSSWLKAREILDQGKELSYSAFTGLPASGDTVGCITVSKGRTAAASSTGGSFLKLPGRIGDTPVIGGGIYASPYGAAICTGLGEAFIRFNMAAWVVNLLAQGVDVVSAAKTAINRLIKNNVSGGILVADQRGNVAAAHNTDSFPVALVIDGQLIKDFKPELI